VVDGSGLSRDNRATCRVLGDLLARGGANGALAQSLAVPGQAGTLDRRFTSPDLAGRVRAKTGTLDQVTSLSGWEMTDPGRNVTFSILINTGGRPVNGTDAAAQTNLLRSILPYPATPALEQISPAPPAAPAAS
jgi:serine-type D-Ala-D-Ala carboxypeptidase/endopeptidase (penicillin-binding protein 4)